MAPVRNALLAGLLLGLAAPLSAQEETADQVPIIPGDPGRDYEVVEEVMWAEPIVVDPLSTYAKAHLATSQKAFQRIRGALEDRDVDAVIDTRVKFVMLPAAQDQRVGDLVVYGTAVRWTGEGGDTATSGGEN